MQGVINTRADLTALKGQDIYGEALRSILGATTMWVNDAVAGEPPIWRQVSVGDTLARLDLTLAELLAECAAAGITPQQPEQPAAQPIPAPPVPTKLYKATVWRRATDAEAAVIDAQLSAAPPRLRRLWDDSQLLDTTYPEFLALRAGFVAAFGESRAAELLAAEM